MFVHILPHIPYNSATLHLQRHKCRKPSRVATDLRRSKRCQAAFSESVHSAQMVRRKRRAQPFEVREPAPRQVRWWKVGGVRRREGHISHKRLPAGQVDQEQAEYVTICTESAEGEIEKTDVTTNLVGTPRLRHTQPDLHCPS